MRGPWHAEVVEVIEELRMAQEKLGAAACGLPDFNLRRVLATIITYLNSNYPRMKYPKYRRAALPVTTAWIESLVKEMNY